MNPYLNSLPTSQAMLSDSSPEAPLQEERVKEPVYRLATRLDV